MQVVEVQDSFLKESYIDCGQLAKTLAMHCNIAKYYTVVRVVAQIASRDGPCPDTPYIIHYKILIPKYHKVWLISAHAY